MNPDYIGHLTRDIQFVVILFALYALIDRWPGSLDRRKRNLGRSVQFLGVERARIYRIKMALFSVGGFLLFWWIEWLRYTPTARADAIVFGLMGASAITLYQSLADYACLRRYGTELAQKYPQTPSVPFKLSRQHYFGQIALALLVAAWFRVDSSLLYSGSLFGAAAIALASATFLLILVRALGARRREPSRLHPTSRLIFETAFAMAVVQTFCQLAGAGLACAAFGSNEFFAVVWPQWKLTTLPVVVLGLPNLLWARADLRESAPMRREFKERLARSRPF